MVDARPAGGTREEEVAGVRAGSAAPALRLQPASGAGGDHRRLTRGDARERRSPARRVHELEPAGRGELHAGGVDEEAHPQLGLARGEAGRGGRRGRGARGRRRRARQGSAASAA